MGQASISRRRAVTTLLTGAAALTAGSGRLLASEGVATIAAASDLQFALTRIADGFRGAAGGGNLRLVFGSSGNFARQIRQGAPFDLFLSADEDYVRDLARDGLTEGDGAVYGLGRIAVVAAKDSPLRPDGSLAGLRAALDQGLVTRFAIANPEHAPYGRRAEEALRHAGLWDAIRPRLVFGENVSQAAQFALSADAQGGIVAYSLALAPEIAMRGNHDLIAAEWHSPLIQRMVLLQGASPLARRFYDHLRQPEAQAVLAEFGFAPPPEAD